MHPGIPIALVFAGCCSNVVFLEFLIKEFPGAGNIITFLQFLFITIEGLIFTSKFGRVKPAIPISDYRIMAAMYLVTVIFQNVMWHLGVSFPLQMLLRSVSVPRAVIIVVYCIMVSFFFCVQVGNNYALNFNISVPLVMIFKSGSLIANLILGVIILKKRYKLSKYLSVIMITAGICICTLASIRQENGQESADEDKEPADVVYENVRWTIGISLLTLALFLSARMGIYQETIYAKHGKHANEALFYNHALPLPGFILLSGDIYNHILLFNDTKPVAIPSLGIAVPIMWLFLLGNVLSQYVCIKSVFILTSECTSLTVTLVVTLRKFVSLLFSIWYFQNPFTLSHWLGTAFVFGGTLIFTEAISNVSKLFASKKQEKTE